MNIIDIYSFGCLTFLGIFLYEPQSLVKMSHKQAPFSPESHNEYKQPSSAGLPAEIYINDIHVQDYRIMTSKLVSILYNRLNISKIKGDLL